MNIVSEWWKKAETEEKIIQLLVVFLTVSIALDRTAAVSISTGAVLLYIIRDCIKQKSHAGFYSPRRNWLGIAVFLLAVLAASVFLGDMPSIQIALKYIYWALPFFLMVYFTKRTDVKYAVMAGAILAVAISSADVAYLYWKGVKFAAGRIGAFSANPNHYAMLLAGILPILFCALADTRIKINKTVLFVNAVVIVMGLSALWKTGSRGAMGGIILGAFFIVLLWSYLHKSLKMFLTGTLLCFAVVSAVLIVGIQGGTHRNGEIVRLRQFQSCYAMWNDHKLLGVGLNNWQAQYSKAYLQTDEIKKDALRRYEEWKAARKKAIEKAAAAKKAAAEKAAKQKANQKTVQPKAAQKPAVNQGAVKKPAIQKPKPQMTAAAKKAAAEKAAKQEAARIAAWQNAAVKYEAGLPIPHNVLAWFFSSTGVIGGIGYLFFVCYYLWILYQSVKDEKDNWIVYTGFWMFTAIHFHGLFDAGITNKGTARLLYLLLGLALSYNQYKKVKDLQDN